FSKDEKRTDLGADMVMIVVEQYTKRDIEDLPRDANGDFIYPEEGSYERDVIAVAPQMTSVDDEPNRRMVLTGIEIYDEVDSPIRPDDFIKIGRASCRE